MPHKQQSHFLIVSAIAPDRAGIANQISEIISSCGCNIVEGKMQVMGNTFTTVLMVEGGWNAIAKLEHQLPVKASSMQMTTMTRRAEKETQHDTDMPYIVDIVTRDNPGISQRINQFFNEHGIEIESVNLDTYPAHHTGVSIGEIRMIVLIPDHYKIAKLREEFNDFCDENNLDASLEAFTR